MNANALPIHGPYLVFESPTWLVIYVDMYKLRWLFFYCKVKVANFK